MAQSLANEIILVPFEAELKQSYLDYAMSVIVGRALPDVRDGLKPVHRRALYSMYESGNDWNKPYKKSARTVGNVTSKYHPHGELAIYETIVRMAQPFSMRYLLVDGQGNFGSVDGDAPAAMRYTEIRMSKLAHTLMADLDKDTVDFVPNYDGTEQAPTVLPTRIPNLLINGSSGIAVGMATNIPPHNLSEVISACLALLDRPELELDQLIRYIPGPDFPTAGLVYGREGILQGYRTGRGRILVRARTFMETDKRTQKQSIIVSELPYQVNKARLIEKIAQLVKDKQIEGISTLRDESDRDGMRIVIEIRRGDSPDVVLNNLFSQTSLQVTFGFNMVALVDGRPQVLTLKQQLNEFLSHRRTVVIRRTRFELRKARARAHILEGLGIALANIDAMIALIKEAKDPQEAKERLLLGAWQLGVVAQMFADCMTSSGDPLGSAYRLSEEQAQAILDLRLHRLTNLEQDKILTEYREQMDHIKYLTEILRDSEQLKSVIRGELQEIKQEFSDQRRTEIVGDIVEINSEDLIPAEEVVVTLSHDGYAKTQKLDVYQAQRRGGKGKSSSQMKGEDFIEHLLVANTHDTLLFFSSLGKAYALKGYQLPQGSRVARGKPIINLLPIREDEKIHAILPITQYREDRFIFMATAFGTVKKTSLISFSHLRSEGIIAIDLREGDRLMGVALTDGQQDVLLLSDAGKVIRFHEREVRSIGRTAVGMRGIKLKPQQQAISLIIARDQCHLLVATENGYGKRTLVSEHRVTGRGGQGVIAIKSTARNGKVIGAVQVSDEDEIMLISDKSTLVRIRASEIRVAGRVSQGVRLIRLNSKEHLAGLIRVQETVD
jgi:DNA gyrase subunit A